MEKVIVYDLDDTLSLYRGYVFSGFQVLNEYLMHDKGIIGFYDHALTYFSRGYRENIFQKVLDKLEQPYDVDMIEELLDLYRSHVPRIHLLEDAEEVLGHYKERYAQALITDGDAHVQRSKISALQLHHWIEFQICTDALGYGRGKPHPEAYLQVMKHFGVDGDHCCYIADNPNKDFVAARKLGWKTARIIREEGEFASVQLNGEYKAELEVADLRELIPVIDGWF